MEPTWPSWCRFESVWKRMLTSSVYSCASKNWDEMATKVHRQAGLLSCIYNYRIDSKTVCLCKIPLGFPRDVSKVAFYLWSWEDDGIFWSKIHRDKVDERLLIQRLIANSLLDLPLHRFLDHMDQEGVVPASSGGLLLDYQMQFRRLKANQCNCGVFNTFFLHTPRRMKKNSLVRGRPIHH